MHGKDLMLGQGESSCNKNRNLSFWHEKDHVDQVIIISRMRFLIERTNLWIPPGCDSYKTPYLWQNSLPFAFPSIFDQTREEARFINERMVGFGRIAKSDKAFLIIVWSGEWLERDVTWRQEVLQKKKRGIRQIHTQEEEKKDQADPRARRRRRGKREKKKERNKTEKNPLATCWDYKRRMMAREKGGKNEKERVEKKT